MNDTAQLSQELENTISELNHHKISWIDKHLIIELKEKAILLLESMMRLKNDEQQSVMIEIKEFLTEVKPVIESINQTGV